MQKTLVFALAMFLGIVMGRWVVINLASHYISKELVKETEDYLESIC